jgi:hypothetical protein
MSDVVTAIAMYGLTMLAIGALVTGYILLRGGADDLEAVRRRR